MKAYLVTPDHESQACVVKTVEVRQTPCHDDPDVMDADYQHICEILGANYVDIVRGGKGQLDKHIGYVDGVGLMTPQPGYILCPQLYALPLAGPILIFGNACHPMVGEYCTAATVNEEDFRALLTTAYVNRRFAIAAHDMSEKLLTAQFPEMIVVRASSEM